MTTEDLFCDLAQENPTKAQLTDWAQNNPTIRFKKLLTWVIEKHDLPTQNIRQFCEGSGFVFNFADKYVFKLVPPNWKEEYQREAAALKIIANENLPVAVPKLLAQGEVNGWNYIITDRLDGENLLGRWHNLSTTDRHRITRQSAEFASALHNIEIPKCAELTVDWHAFINKQRKNCYSFRASQGLKFSLLESMESYLDNINYTTKEKKLRLTHCDLHAGNFLAKNTSEGWQLAGVIDFGDAFYSPEPLFEANTALIFSGITDAPTNRIFLDTFGIEIPEDKQVLQDRLMALSILRHSGSLNYLFDYLPKTKQIDNWSELARTWFAL